MDFWDPAGGSNAPVDWSDSSLIFAAHPSQPLVTARHSSTSKSFLLPHPQPIVNTPHLFLPATIVSAAPHTRWLFTYFPGKENDGLACIWKRGPSLDTWVVMQFFPWTSGNGVVTVSWLSERNHREWVPDSTGNFTRRAHLGPFPVISNPTLILVTQRHEIRVLYLRDYLPQFLAFKSRLNHHVVMYEMAQSEDPLLHETGFNRICTHAAIGPTYDNTLLIATRSRRYPSSQHAVATPLPVADATAAMDLDATEVEWNDQWDHWGEEETIELAEVALKFNGTMMLLQVKPLEPIQLAQSTLSRLCFIDGPYETHTKYLLSICTDFCSAATPSSHLRLYTFKRKPLDGQANLIECTHTLAGQRTFENQIIATVHATPLHDTIFLSRVDGARHKRFKGKEIKVGEMIPLTLPLLEDDSKFDSSDIRISDSSFAISALPVHFASSPNRLRFATLSGSLQDPSMTVQTFPQTQPWESLADGSVHPHALTIIAAILSERTVDDVVSLLCDNDVTESSVAVVLESAFQHCRGHLSSFGHRLIWEVLGVALCVYRTREGLLDGERRSLVQWQDLQDISSLITCETALKECKEPIGQKAGEGQTVWPLVEISIWVVSYLEHLIKQCLYDDFLDTIPQSGQSSELPSMYVHMAHPLVIQTMAALVRHIIDLGKYLESLPSLDESSKIARFTLKDIVDQSGLDFVLMEKLLQELLEDSHKLKEFDSRRALLFGDASPDVIAFIRTSVKKLHDSNVVDKARLMLKALDLVDGLTSEGPMKIKDKGRDIVTKSCLKADGPWRLCLRCGGRSDLPSIFATMQQPGQPKPLTKWQRFERRLFFRCICGGNWCST
ncbi:hypothetical protein DL96DRAFT_1577965 [Flagelloscypha sp. PMI_526]|nr:hypothetical protein DL96DRAFT_1577965 [Flagelloscypha sp. PMI_526]